MSLCKCPKDKWCYQCQNDYYKLRDNANRIEMQWAKEYEEEKQKDYKQLKEKEEHIRMSSRKSATEINLKNRTLVSSQTLADMLGLSVLTIRNHYRNRKIPGTKVGRTIYFDSDSAMRALSIVLPTDKAARNTKKYDPTDDM